MKIRVVVRLASVVAALALAEFGCAGMAMQSLNDAHAAMALAQASEAEKYAPVTYQIALANYELARDHFVANTKKDTRVSVKLSKMTVIHAERAASEAVAARNMEEERNRVAAGAIENRRAEETSVPPPAPAVEENQELVAKRYIALAQRRLKVAAMSKAGASPPVGMVEIEVWIAPNGVLTQVLIVQGNPDDMLTRTVLHGLQGFNLEPFPKGLNQKYLKLRVTIDTRR